MNRSLPDLSSANDAYRMPDLKGWNALPTELLFLMDHSAFKRQLKTFLFESTFTTRVSRRWSH